MLAIFEAADLYDLLGAEGDAKYGMLMGAELCLKDLLRESREALNAIDKAEMADTVSPKVATHG